MVKRYDCDVCYDVGMTAHVSGDWVSYSDYATLLKERDALAAENAEMRSSIDATIGWQESTDPENVESVRMLFDIKTPATDAFLAEVRAQGVELFVSHMDHPHSPYEFTHGYMDKHAIEFAAKLRQECSHEKP